MSNLRFLASFLVFSCVITLSISLARATTLASELIHAKNDYQQCIEALPAKFRRRILNPSAPAKRTWSLRMQKKVRTCLEKRRTKEDYEDKIAFSEDLKGFYQGKLDEGDREEMGKEAEKIGSTLVDSTRALNKEYRMAESALWHNFLIKLGAKDGGYCYHWTEWLLKALPREKFKYFERHWGVHNMDKVTENNAVIITKPGQPISSGIVYDAWRGRGKPFWRFVSKDRQSWKERYTENEILYGYHIWPSGKGWD